MQLNLMATSMARRLKQDGCHELDFGSQFRRSQQVGFLTVLKFRTTRKVAVKEPGQATDYREEKYRKRRNVRNLASITIRYPMDTEAKVFG
jgi:hypothetical protein